MKFSLIPPNQSLRDGARVFDFDSFIAQCRAAEAAGFSAVYTGEKHEGETSYSPNPMLLAGAALAHTAKIDAGVALSILPIHHPTSVAEDASMLSTMYRGRFRLAVGAGYFGGDFGPFGVSLDERTERMEEGLAAITAFNEGRPYQFRRGWAGRLQPRDRALAPTGPVYVGTSTRSGVRRAARAADGWFSDPVRHIDWLVEFATIYREECRRLGRTPYVILMREAWLGETDDSALQEYGEHILNYSRLYIARGNFYHPKWDPWMTEIHEPADVQLRHVLPGRVLCGSAKTWIDTLGEWQRIIKPDEVLVRLSHYSGPSVQLTLEVIARIGREIIPRFAR
jgi:alkanesulfonate monooxygenase SsuD/methylene tetrahydromethanopterin reductase-like flavin-dependent oxidoreductase (luciferase family)